MIYDTSCCQLVAYIFTSEGLESEESKALAHVVGAKKTEDAWEGGPSITAYCRFVIETYTNAIYVWLGIQKASGIHAQIGLEGCWFVPCTIQ